jgi:hypothetical protein
VNSTKTRIANPHPLHAHHRFVCSDVHFPAIGDSYTQGKRAMTKNLALAASITMLIAISGQAFADTASTNARYWSNATDSSDRQVVNAFNAFDPAMAAQTAEPNAYRYHGGPKSND